MVGLGWKHAGKESKPKRKTARASSTARRSWQQMNVSLSAHSEVSFQHFVVSTQIKSITLYQVVLPCPCYCSLLGKCLPTLISMITQNRIETNYTLHARLCAG